MDKDNIPYFLEIYIFPGLTIANKVGENHVYHGYMATETGYSIKEFIGKIVKSSIDRYK